MGFGSAVAGSRISFLERVRYWASSFTPTCACCHPVRGPLLTLYKAITADVELQLSGLEITMEELILWISLGPCSLKEVKGVFSEVKCHYEVFSLSLLSPNGLESISSGSITLLQKLLFSPIFPALMSLCRSPPLDPASSPSHTSTAEHWLLSLFWSLLLKNDWSRGLDSCSPPLYSHGLAAFAFHTLSQVPLVTAAGC